jgi:hypothetical protein
VQRLAAAQGRAQSWTVRDLIRCELRRRGLLLANTINTVADKAAADASVAAAD